MKPEIDRFNLYNRDLVLNIFEFPFTKLHSIAQPHGNECILALSSNDPRMDKLYALAREARKRVWEIPSANGMIQCLPGKGAEAKYFQDDNKILTFHIRSNGNPNVNGLIRCGKENDYTLLLFKCAPIEDQERTILISLLSIYSGDPCIGTVFSKTEPDPEIVAIVDEVMKEPLDAGN